MTVLITAPEDLDIVSIRRIASGARVRLDPLLTAVAAHRKRVLASLTQSAKPVYGVNTGMGRFVGTVLTPAQQADHQVRLLGGRAVGGPPWLPEADVRALFAVRLRDLLMPETGASAELVRFVADRLNDGFVPAVPRTGLGSAGEIIPLSHAFQTFAGIGTVLEDGQEVPAQKALSDRGADRYRPGPKEGISLLQGTPVALAHALLRGEQASLAVDKQLVVCAMSVDVLGAPRGVYLPALGGPDQILTGVLAEVHALTAEALERPELVQAPVSVRVAPHAIAYARRTVAELEAAAGRVLATPTDSPAFVDGEFVSTAGFHATELGLRMDAVTASLTHLAEVGVQRMHRMLDDRFSGLPAQLTPDPGPQAGLSPLHKRAVGELHAMRRLCMPATLGSLDTSAGQEDVQAFACAAGEQLREVLDRLLVITACELVAAHQAHVLRGNPGAPALRDAYRQIGEVVPAVLTDRPLGGEITALVRALRSWRSGPWAPRGGSAD